MKKSLGIISNRSTISDGHGIIVRSGNNWSGSKDNSFYFDSLNIWFWLNSPYSVMFPLTGASFVSGKGIIDSTTTNYLTSNAYQRPALYDNTSDILTLIKVLHVIQRR